MNGKRRKGRQKKRLEDKSKSGQGWTLPAQLGQLKIKQDGKGLLRSHLWCLNDLARLWDKHSQTRLEQAPSYLL